MKRWLVQLTQNKIVRNGVIIFIGTFGVSVLNYMFNVLMGRLLGPEQFGSFVSLVSVLYIIGIFGSTIGLVGTKFSASYFAKGDYKSLYSFFYYVTILLMIVSVFSFCIFIICSFWIKDFLKFSSIIPIWILGLTFLLTFVLTFNISLLQGMHKFTSYSLNTFVSTIFKILIAIVLTTTLMTSNPLNGAVLALPLSMLVGYLFSFYSLKSLLAFKSDKNIKAVQWNHIGMYVGPVFLALSGMTFLYTFDIILVKHFLSPLEAGYYSALSTLGKIIFFASSAVPSAMFPIVAAKYEQKERHIHLLYTSLGIVLGISLCAVIVYSLFPTFILGLLVGKEYISVAPLLPRFAVIMMLYSIVNILVYYYLSIHKVFITFMPIIWSIILVILLYFFHNDLAQVVTVILGNMIMLFVSTALVAGYYQYEEYRSK